jgi:molybdate transport system substrate-binding protein
VPASAAAAAAWCCRRLLLPALVLALSCTWPALAGARELVVFSAGAVKPALAEIAPRWQAASGHTLRISYMTAGELRRHLAEGGRADVVILPLENFAAVEAAGLTRAATRRDLGTVGIGVAVRADAPALDIATEEGLRRALLQAKSVTYMDPARGTSGKHMDEVVLPRLGLRDQVRTKAVLGEGGMIAEKVARGEVEIAFQQMTELLPVAGVRIAGSLPATLQKVTVYSAAVMGSAAGAAEGAALIDYLSTGPGRAVFLARGFGPP